MALLAATVASLLIQTANLCSEPVAGGVGEPYFCFVAESTVIETPYFSLRTPPESLVGIDREGARVIVQASIRQSGIALVIEAHANTEMNRLYREVGRCGNLDARSDSFFVCVRSTDEFMEITTLRVGGKRLVFSTLSSGQTGFSLLNGYRETLDSVVAQ